MNQLTSSTRKLQIVLAGAKATNDCPWVSSWEDVAGSGQPPIAGTATGKTNGVTTVDVVLAPSATAGGTRKLTSFGLSNADTAPVVVSILYVDGASSFAVVGPITLQMNDSLGYTEQAGWFALDGDSNIKTSGGGNVTQLSSQASSLAALHPASVSSQASSMAALHPDSVSSQASSAAALSPASVSSQASSMASALKSSYGW